MVMASQLVSFQPLLTFPKNMGEDTAFESLVNDRSDTFLDLLNGNRWGPFFFPVELPSLRTRWR